MNRRQRGFALLIVLLTMGFLGFLGTSLIAAGRSDTSLADNLREAAELQAAAEGAIAHAAFAAAAEGNPAFRPGPTALEIRIGAIPVLVHIQNEDDRINLNTCPPALLRAFLAELGVAPREAAALTVAVVEWRGGGSPGQNGAAAARYRSAGLSYGPPGLPFQSLDEVRLVLGMTPQLFALMAPHMTVLTDGDPEMTTQDPIVARALADAAGAVDAAGLASGGGSAEPFLRITATALGPRGARYTVTAVTTTSFFNADPRIRILFRERCIVGMNSASC
jgi:general secretion pathway protein K